ncbi:MAG: BatA domain-containing protein [Gemmatimonadota bacterium]
MSFLAPLFLAGLAALAIPVIIHLRQREEKAVVEFPSLMFLQGIPFHSERRKSIKHPLLLALRLLALILVVAAFARPFLQGDGTATAGVVGPRELVVLLDRSWSMAYEDRWDEARTAVRDAVASQGPRDRTTLILFDDGASAPVRSSPSPDQVLRVVDDAEPGERATRYAPALRLARSVLETSELPRREVILVSDHQASGWSGEEDVALDPGIAFTPVSVGNPDQAWSNASVADVELRRSLTGTRDAVVPTARIILRGGGEGGGITGAVLEVDGQVRDRMDAGLQRGGAEVEFGAVPLADEPQRAVVRIQNDDLPQDDAHYSVLSPGRGISVLIVEPPTPRDNASLYLRRALELSRDPPFTVEVTNTGLPSNLQERFDVVVVADRSVSVDDLRTFLEEGGGVLWAPGAAEVVSSDAGSELGARIGAVRDHDRSSDVRLGTVDRDHPVFQPFRESGTGNFAAARFFRSRRLEPSDSARVLARFDDGNPALLEARIGRGRILTWAATLDTYWTNLPIQPVFLPFVHRSVLHLADRQEEVPARTVGSVLSPVAEDGGSETGPAPAGSRWAAAVTPSEERIELDGREAPLVLEEAGFYELLDDEGQVVDRVAVNVDPREGDLTRRDTEEIVAAVAGAGPTETDSEAAEGGMAGIRSEDLERHQGFWRYLLIAAFVLFVGETIVSNRISEAMARRTAQ